MRTKRTSKATRYLKFAIPLVIALALALVFLFRYRSEKKAETEEVEKEAVKRIEALKAEVKEPIDLEKADHFVSAQTVLTKKQRKIVTTTPKALLEDESIGPENEIKVLFEEEKTIITTPRELLENRTIGPDTPIRVLKEGGLVTETTPRGLLADQSIGLDTPVKIIQTEEKMIVTTPAELLKKGLSPETPIKILVEKPGEPLTLAKILPEAAGDEEGTFFYVHTVTREDVQGIWGVIQHGLTEQFLKGVPVAAGGVPKKKEILTLKIPGSADEPAEGGYSSFLGRLLNRKTKESFVYNYASGRMGRNPDYISPGQELVVSRFSEKELVEIYKHFHGNP
jgi:hypothetical protein